MNIIKFLKDEKSLFQIGIPSEYDRKDEANNYNTYLNNKPFIENEDYIIKNNILYPRHQFKKEDIIEFNIKRKGARIGDYVGDNTINWPLGFIGYNADDGRKK